MEHFKSLSKYQWMVYDGYWCNERTIMNVKIKSIGYI